MEPDDIYEGKGFGFSTKLSQSDYNKISRIIYNILNHNHHIIYTWDSRQRGGIPFASMIGSVLTLEHFIPMKSSGSGAGYVLISVYEKDSNGSEYLKATKVQSFEFDLPIRSRITLTTSE